MGKTILDFWDNPKVSRFRAHGSDFWHQPKIRRTIQGDQFRAHVLDFCKMFGKFTIYSPRYINAKTFGLSAGHPRCSEFAPRLGRMGRRILVQLPKHPVPTRAASAVLAFRDPATAVRTIKEVVTAAFGSPLNRRQSQPHDVGDGFAPRLPPDPPGGALRPASGS